MMLHLRTSVRLGAHAAEHWYVTASLSAAHAVGCSRKEEDPPDRGQQPAAHPCQLDLSLDRLRLACPPLPGGSGLPFGLLSASAWAPGGASQLRRFSSSPPELLSDLPASSDADLLLSDLPTSEVAEGAVSAAAAAASGGSEVAAIADQSIAPIAGIQYMLEAMHQYTGLPWWATIALTTFTARLCLFPITLYQMRSTAKMTAIRPELEKLSAKLKENVGDPQAAEQYQRQMAELFKKNNLNPVSTMASAFAQAPLFIGFFLAIRRMSENLPSFKEGGLFWFTDLSGADPTYLLPAICAATFLVTVEVGAMEGMQGQPVAKNMKNAMRVLGVAMIPLTMSFEKALFCYWIPSNLFSLLQAAVLKVPGVKATLGIPVTSEASQPVSNPASAIPSGMSDTGISSTQTQVPLIRQNKKRRSKRK